VDNKHSVNKIVEVVRAEFPLVRLLVRSYDREHSLELIAARVDYQIRETFESAVSFGEAALIQLGVAREEAAAMAVDVRRRDAERLQLELAGGLAAGASLMRGNAPKPTPFTQPVRESRALSEETALVTRVNEENPAT
jgi:glutathione-regulated potassium-efflux system protein KefB